MLLVNAEDNYHTLGVQMAQYFYTTQGISTVTVLPGVPTHEILDLLHVHKPQVIGFSVGLPTQMRQVREVVTQIQELPLKPGRILVGGPAVRFGLNPDPSLGITLCADLQQSLPFFSAELKSQP